jgi:hypothetical protein
MVVGEMKTMKLTSLGLDNLRGRVIEYRGRSDRSQPKVKWQAELALPADHNLDFLRGPNQTLPEHRLEMPCDQISFQLASAQPRALFLDL